MKILLNPDAKVVKTIKDGLAKRMDIVLAELPV